MQFCQYFIEIKNKKLQKLTELEKDFLIKVANILNPFYSSYKAKKLQKEYEQNPQETRKKIGKYKLKTNNCRHFVLGLAGDLYDGLINIKDLDWKISAKTKNPKVKRTMNEDYSKNKEYKEPIILVGFKFKKNDFAQEGDIIRIRRKNGSYHVGIIIKDEEGKLQAIDYTGAINKRSIKEFTENAVEITIWRISEHVPPI